jgi:hypothetical protein
VRSPVAISGRASAGARASSRSAQQCTATPGPRRAARPARCATDACEAGTVTSPANPRRRSSRGSRARPASTTMCTPGTVSDDSAIAVATITRRSPSGGSASAASCSADDIDPCSGRASIPRPRSRPTTASTSRRPGRNASSDPSGWAARACSIVAATCVRNALVTPRSSSRATPSGGGAQTVRSGCGRAGTRSTRASSPSSPAQRSASSVADMTARVRSSRSWATSSDSANARSPSRPRSCTSSITTALTPASSGSASSRRTSRPFVTNTTRAAGETRRSPRTAYPARSPTRVPVRDASRAAAARAASRRGSATTTRPDAWQAIAGGTTVVLPEPGGASTTSRGAASRANAAARPGSTAPAGRPRARVGRSKADTAGTPPASHGRDVGARWPTTIGRARVDVRAPPRRARATGLHSEGEHT